MFAPQEYSDLHKLIWISGIIASLGGAVAAFLGITKWMTAIYKRAGSVIAHIDAIPVIAASQSAAAEVTAEVKAGVDLLQTNHMVHIGAALDKQTDLLVNMDKSLGILVDRSPRTSRKSGR